MFDKKHPEIGKGIWIEDITDEKCLQCECQDCANSNCPLESTCDVCDLTSGEHIKHCNFFVHLYSGLDSWND